MTSVIGVLIEQKQKSTHQQDSVVVAFEAVFTHLKVAACALSYVVFHFVFSKDGSWNPARQNIGRIQKESVTFANILVLYRVRRSANVVKLAMIHDRV